MKHVFLFLSAMLAILAYAREHGLRMYGHHLPAPGYIE